MPRASILDLCLPFALASGLLHAGCGGTSVMPVELPDMTVVTPPADMSQGGGNPDLTGGAPDLTVDNTCSGKETFTEAYTAMLSGCAGAIMCHERAPFGAGLDLRRANAWKGIVNVQAAGAMKTIVVPGDHARSFLYQKVTNTQGGFEGAPMPKTEGLPWQAPDPAKLKVLRCWIDNGAKND